MDETARVQVPAVQTPVEPEKEQKAEAMRPLQKSQLGPQAYLQAEIPFGFCHCGCGNMTRIARYSNPSRGHVKGEPLKFFSTHGCLLARKLKGQREAEALIAAGELTRATPRRQQVLKLRSQGLAYYDIAEQLGICKQSAQVHAKPAHSRTKNREWKRTAYGRAVIAWNSMNMRCRSEKPNFKKIYENVEVRITRADFIAWAVPEFEKWIAEHPDLDQVPRWANPTVDRIEGSGHYELGNIRIISRRDNTRNQPTNWNVFAPEGKAWCGACKQYKATSEFNKDSSTFNGLGRRCKPCKRIADHESYQRRRNRQ
jgi:DNA-binding CsgD family transcriptional regulator